MASALRKLRELFRKNQSPPDGATLDLEDIRRVAREAEQRRETAMEQASIGNFGGGSGIDWATTPDELTATEVISAEIDEMAAARQAFINAVTGPQFIGNRKAPSVGPTDEEEDYRLI